MELKSITSFVVLVFAFLMMVFTPISASTSSPLEIGSCEDDQVCWYLFDENLGTEGELFLDSTLPGIALTIEESGSDPNLNKYLEIGFDTTKVKTRSWSLDEDFYTKKGTGTFFIPINTNNFIKENG